MKVYISCDMEGTAGLCARQQCDPDDAHEYPTYRRYMTGEVSAAIEGALEAGAGGIVVNDSHWNMRNLLVEELPAGDVRVVTGTRKPWSMGEGLDALFDAAFLTGYHAKAGETATLSHTFASETIYDVRVNGTRCSEALLVAALAGSYGVPVVLVTGDDSIVAECGVHLPWAIGVAVKNAIGFSAVNSLTPATARDAIRAGARAAVERIANAKPFTFAGPCELQIDTAAVEQADFIELMPGFERIGGRTVRFHAPAYPQAYRAFVAATRLGAAANA